VQHQQGCRRGLTAHRPLLPRGRCPLLKRSYKSCWLVALLAPVPVLVNSVCWHSSCSRMVVHSQWWCGGCDARTHSCVTGAIKPHPA
jgi:hypothetical protein